MSRNIGSTCCDVCGGKVTATGKPRPIKRSEAGAYYAEYKGLTVAYATCRSCKARYLAWVKRPPTGKHSWASWCRFISGKDAEIPPEPEAPFYDLSYRSTFNDEPGPKDCPGHDLHEYVLPSKR